MAQDDTVVIVSTLPLRVSGGPAEIRRWGPVVAMSPAAPARGGWTGREVRGFGVLCVMAASLVSCFGARWWPALALPGLALIGLSPFAGTERRRGSVVRPDDTRPAAAHRVLVTADGRAALAGVVAVAERSCAAWPALGTMLDLPSAEHALAQSIFNLAGLIERRERLRKAQDDLRAQTCAGLPESNPAVRSLGIQQDRIDRALSELDAEIARRTTALENVASVSEDFVCEEALRRATRDAERVLAEFADEDPPSRPGPSERLAEEIEVVLAAYRELMDLSDGPA
ncbi:hypothetical protein ACFQFC_07825 [Amorphoplanes digitatis]|uniref:Uncharacterized protein n=1 Tax=Actinoplanes digitatis TaxID=1868 RepID=A0A7W7I0D7_9ACTN|nr:hypothetical protein [Actinoplanes digitatis]MBB4764111.1 hypothetical protein [Actinoplanes digitatis]